MDGAPSEMHGVRITNSRAVMGGGIFVRGAVPAMRYVSIAGCSATDTGGGLVVMGNSAVRASALTIESCSTEGEGGGVSVIGSTLELDDGSKVIDCTAQSGGLIKVTGSSSSMLTVNGGSFSGGRASGPGACLLVSGSASGRITHSAFSDCVAQGGGAWAQVSAS